MTQYLERSIKILHQNRCALGFLMYNSGCSDQNQRMMFCFYSSGGATLQRNVSTNATSKTCSECGKVFGSPALLKRHALVHSGARPFTCEVCGKHFRQMGHVRTHMIVHTREREHRCEYCGQLFGSNSNMKRHKQLCKGRYGLPNKFGSEISAAGIGMYENMSKLD